MNNRPYIRVGGVDHGIDNEDLAALYRELQLFFGGKIKLHPMSEEPVMFADKHRSDSNVYIVSSGLYRAYGLNEKEEGAQQYIYIGDKVSWKTISAISSLAFGWVYEHELIQHIKNNTAP